MNLPAEYEQRFDAMLQAVGKTGIDKEICAFWPVQGKDFLPERQMMVIGQAPNGWEANKKCTDLVDDLSRAALISEAKQKANTPECPDPNTRFWKVARRAYEGRFGAQQNWFSKIGWTNIWKVAPSEGGNPRGKLLSAQWMQTLELLRIEVERWHPEVALVFTNSNWFEDYAERLNLPRTSGPATGLVQQTARTMDTFWIIGKHPARNGEADYVNEIAAILNEVSIY